VQSFDYLRFPTHPSSSWHWKPNHNFTLQAEKLLFCDVLLLSCLSR
jgi:hypothetical protein